MSEKKSLADRGLGWIKSVFFERGNLVYLANIPFLRRSLRKINGREKKEKIRIGFLVQCPENWEVIRPVYEAACGDGRTEPVVLLVPEMEYAFYIRLKRVLWEEVYAFGERQFGGKAVRTYDPETGRWTDPETLELDYVFIPRPYETYLPGMYRASSLRKTAKVCYVPYGFLMIRRDYQLVYNTHFMRNVSMVFCDLPRSEEYIRKKFRPTVRSGDLKCFSIGFPRLDRMELYREGESPLWPRGRSEGITRILWTPRWTTDPLLGGSTFFTYKDAMIGWAEGDGGIDLLFRPHPLALSHYVKAGLMTEEEEQQYLDRFAACGNANVDRTESYAETFWSSDLLISDVSSMIPEYLSTGKPVLYTGAAGNEIISSPELNECLYRVHSFREIRETVRMLREGKDPLREARMKLIRQLKPGESAAAGILREIRRDYGKE